MTTPGDPTPTFDGDDGGGIGGDITSEIADEVACEIDGDGDGLDVVSTTPVADAFTRVTDSCGGGMAPQNEIVTHATADYLDLIDPADPPRPRLLEKQLLVIVHGVCAAAWAAQEDADG